MTIRFLHDELDSVSRFGGLNKEIPDCIKQNLNPRFKLRPYQEEAFSRFLQCFDNDYPEKRWPLHLLFNMATGSGKTLIMAGLLLLLYDKGYRNFLFFVNSSHIIEKTRFNFLNSTSSKYLFNESLYFGSKVVTATAVENFEGVSENDINICFTTIQKLHYDLTNEKEDSLTFDDFRWKKTVLISDEAHHINVRTTQTAARLEATWEDTVERIFRQNDSNLLLEFTATLDFTHPNIVHKYTNKVLYRYDLRQFRNDGYSKDVMIVKTDFEEHDRILQALILNQYKQEVAAKYSINLKPVILFKAQKTIAQSKENKVRFHSLVENLSEEDIDRIRQMSELTLVRRAFQFFSKNQIIDSQLVQRLRWEFDEHRCISVNNDNDKENLQFVLNSLEDPDNRVRAIFAVQKLNEGWDVLNLFDIVRCYETRDSVAGRPGRTTIAEAQLIGRGARYFPFELPDHADRYRRKFDKNLDSELRVLEELHYHSLNDSRYVAEIQKALIETGIKDENVDPKRLALKDAFKATGFYNEGLIYLNERVINRSENVRSFSDLNISTKGFRYYISTGKGTSAAILNDSDDVSLEVEPASRILTIKDIPRHIVRSAISQNPFFSFLTIKRYFPHVKSVRQFISSDEYLGNIEIVFRGGFESGYSLSNEDKFKAILSLLSQIESEVQSNFREYKGTKSFKPNCLQSVFTDKNLHVVKDSVQADGDVAFVSDRPWYAFNANYGTSEEKDFVRMLDSQTNRLKERFIEMYLVRNERHFKIYNFDDGQAFEPDFVLFLREKGDEQRTYQVFIEPKGKHLKSFDKWKEDFLTKITEQHAGQLLDFETQTKHQKHRLIGLPFYNVDDENKFKDSLYSTLEE